jgi:hypothetical protein
MAKNKQAYLDQVSAGGVVAVIRAPSPDVAARHRAGAAGRRRARIEVTMTTPKAIRGIEKLADQLGGQSGHRRRDDPGCGHPPRMRFTGGAVRRFAHL